MMTENWPEDCIQYCCDANWWIKDETNLTKRGRLIRCVLPHVDVVPQSLVAESRATDHTDHSRALFRLEAFRAGARPPRASEDRLPVAAAPPILQETRLTYRAKKRPALIVAMPGTQVDRNLTRGSPKWQASPLMLVAPYYGVDQDGSRAGWNPEFVERIRRADYPQYMWDLLPIQNGMIDGSILRFDHIQPLGNHQASYEILPYRLGNEALDVMDEWVSWLMQGSLRGDGLLATAKELFTY